MKERNVQDSFGEYQHFDWYEDLLEEEKRKRDQSSGDTDPVLPVDCSASRTPNHGKINEQIETGTRNEDVGSHTEMFRFDVGCLLEGCQACHVSCNNKKYQPSVQPPNEPRPSVRPLNCLKNAHHKPRPSVHPLDGLGVAHQEHQLSVQPQNEPRPSVQPLHVHQPSVQPLNGLGVAHQEHQLSVQPLNEPRQSVQPLDGLGDAQQEHHLSVQPLNEPQRSVQPLNEHQPSVPPRNGPGDAHQEHQPPQHSGLVVLQGPAPAVQSQLLPGLQGQMYLTQDFHLQSYQKPEDSPNFYAYPHQNPSYLHQSNYLDENQNLVPFSETVQLSPESLWTFPHTLTDDGRKTSGKRMRPSKLRRILTYQGKRENEEGLPKSRLQKEHELRMGQISPPVNGQYASPLNLNSRGQYFFCSAASNRMPPYPPPASNGMTPFSLPVSNRMPPYFPVASNKMSPFSPPVSNIMSPFSPPVSNIMSPFSPPVSNIMPNFSPPVSNIMPYFSPPVSNRNPPFSPASMSPTSPLGENLNGLEDSPRNLNLRGQSLFCSPVSNTVTPAMMEALKKNELGMTLIYPTPAHMLGIVPYSPAPAFHQHTMPPFPVRHLDGPEASLRNLSSGGQSLDCSPVSNAPTPAFHPNNTMPPCPVGHLDGPEAYLRNLSSGGQSLDCSPVSNAQTPPSHPHNMMPHVQ